MKTAEPIKAVVVSTIEQMKKEQELEHLKEMTDDLKALTQVTNVDEKL